MKFAGFSFFLGGRGGANAGTLDSGSSTCNRTETAEPAKCCAPGRGLLRGGSALALCFPHIPVQLVRSAFTRSFHSYQLLVMLIKYIPGARRHQLLASGAPQRGLAGSWGEGWGLASLPACPPACPPGCSVGFDRPGRGVPGLVSPQTSSDSRAAAVPERSSAAGPG